MHQETSLASGRDGAKRIKLILGMVSVVVLVLAASTVAFFLIFRKSDTTGPFDAELLAATNFTLYYPRKLPSGFHIDTKSVNTPQSGVVVFDMLNSQGQKIYMSEEARSPTFNFGGYYKIFSDRKEVVTPQGTVATGYINNDQTTLGSLVVNGANGTWVIVNTPDHNVTPSNLATLLEHLTTSQ